VLKDWLSRTERTPSPYSEFDVIDIEPVEDPSPDHETYLAQLLHEAMVDPELFESVAAEFGWNDEAH
jgi:hypothetical protein